MSRSRPRSPAHWTRRLMLAATASLASIGSAQALSCLAPNFAEEYNRLHAAPDTYYVGLGTLTPVEPEPPQVNVGGDINRPVERQRRYRFTGGFLLGDGITQSRNYAVQTTAACAGPWCGGFPNDPATALIFLKVEAGGYRFSHTFGACPGGSYTHPSNDQIRAIQRCLRSGGCGPAEQALFSMQY